MSWRARWPGLVRPKEETELEALGDTRRLVDEGRGEVGCEQFAAGLVEKGESAVEQSRLHAYNAAMNGQRISLVAAAGQRER